MEFFIRTKSNETSVLSIFRRLKVQSSETRGGGGLVSIEP